MVLAALGSVIRVALRLLVALLGSVLFAFFSMLVLVAINDMIYGSEAFRHNAGAKFFVFAQWAVIGFPLSLVALCISFNLTGKIPALSGRQPQETRSPGTL
ncbi:MAG: hypothetical protein JNN08_21630 [Bryobacterales bacterium]|nr:hypothetical protein [Bryobacterales bacterium]